MLKLNPVITIISGIIVTITMAYVGFLIIDAKFGILHMVLLYSSFIIGGFISTYFTEKRHTVYGIYEGLILSIMFSAYVGTILTDNGLTYINYISAYSVITLVITSATSIGSTLGRKR